MSIPQFSSCRGPCVLLHLTAVFLDIVGVILKIQSPRLDNSNPYMSTSALFGPTDSLLYEPKDMRIQVSYSELKAPRWIKNKVELDTRKQIGDSRKGFRQALQRLFVTDNRPFSVSVLL